MVRSSRSKKMRGGNSSGFSTNQDIIGAPGGMRDAGVSSVPSAAGSVNTSLAQSGGRRRKTKKGGRRHTRRHITKRRRMRGGNSSGGVSYGFSGNSIVTNSAGAPSGIAGATQQPGGHINPGSLPNGGR